MPAEGSDDEEEDEGGVIEGSPEGEEGERMRLPDEGEFIRHAGVALRVPLISELFASQTNTRNKGNCTLFVIGSRSKALPTSGMVDPQRPQAQRHRFHAPLRHVHDSLGTGSIRTPRNPSRNHLKFNLRVGGLL